MLPFDIAPEPTTQGDDHLQELFQQRLSAGRASAGITLVSERPELYS